MASLIGYGMLKYLVRIDAVGRRTGRVLAWGAATLLALAIDVSRLHLGVHYWCGAVAEHAGGCLGLRLGVKGVEVARRRGGAIEV